MAGRGTKDLCDDENLDQPRLIDRRSTWLLPSWVIIHGGSMGVNPIRPQKVVIVAHHHQGFCTYLSAVRDPGEGDVGLLGRSVGRMDLARCLLWLLLVSAFVRLAVDGRAGWLEELLEEWEPGQKKEPLSAEAEYVGGLLYVRGMFFHQRVRCAGRPQRNTVILSASLVF